MVEGHTEHQLIEKAERALVAARRNFAAGDYDFASSRAYYAVYNALQAILHSQGVATSKHSGTRSEFGRLFLKTRIFPREFGKLLRQLFDDRQAADYDPGLSITRADAELDLEAAARMVDAIKDYLKK